MTPVRTSHCLLLLLFALPSDLNIDEPRLLGICQTPCRRADTAARCLGLALLEMKTVHSMAYVPIKGTNRCGVKQMGIRHPVKLTAIGL